MDDTTPKVSPVPILRCRNRECKTWIREEMVSGDSPGCPLCKGEMIRSIKHLPKLVNKVKAPQKAEVQAEPVQV
ncbi:cold-inducible protein YdjO-related protein [Paenibacillus xerothermodurans]|uniref:Cold-shock protein n=1 Tax=Paenibacillus xerothermodurans TaxID=1977292 RepID=A0A2W1NRL6_PAEXE|nr:cold-inducible protein YdjO-related protein [Paenibacillus xerothermodurans]PZE21523.1 hypothetical protein CBW46_007965 [Paenibacillus xerothermodurans]